MFPHVDDNLYYVRIGRGLLDQKPKFFLMTYTKPTLHVLLDI